MSELILLANQVKPLQQNQFQISVCTIQIPDSIKIVEAVTENVSSTYRREGRLIISDGRNLVFFPKSEEHHFTDFAVRNLQIINLDDRKIIKRLIEKALEISIKRITEEKDAWDISPRGSDSPLQV